ncbi:MAG: hypothetical protein R2710_29380 [Acidimicrobiales bacterium]
MSELLASLDDLIDRAQATPAWVERHLQSATELVATAADDGDDRQPALDRLAVLTNMFDDVPQVVGLNDDASFSRAEWVDECLFLTIVFTEPDPDRRAMFRIVRAEPRVWYQTGIDGATNEITGRAVIVRLPCVDGVLEFVPGSY